MAQDKKKKKSLAQQLAEQFEKARNSQRGPVSSDDMRAFESAFNPAKKKKKKK